MKIMKSLSTKMNSWDILELDSNSNVFFCNNSDIQLDDFHTSHSDRLKKIADDLEKQQGDFSALSPEVKWEVILVEWLKEQYRKMIDEEGSKIVEIFEESRKSIKLFLFSYINQVRRSAPNLSLDDYVTTIAYWSRVAMNCSQIAHDNTSTLVFNREVTGELREDLKQSLDHVSTFHQRLCSFLYVLVYTESMDAIPSERRDCVIPYNFWGRDYSHMKTEALKKAFPGKDRVLLYPEKNFCSFSLEMQRIIISFSDCSVFSDKYKDDKDKLENWLFNLVSDYLVRLKSLKFDNNNTITWALKSWIVCTWLAVQSELDAVMNRYMDWIWSEGIYHGEDVEMMINSKKSMLGRIGKIVKDTLISIWEDKATVQKTLEMEHTKERSTPTITVFEDESQQNDEDKQNYVAYTHGKKVFCIYLYNLWKKVALKNITIEDFYTAIVQPDFGKIIEKVESLRGYVGAVKYLMITLKKYLGDEWYIEACASIQSSPEKVDKLNRNTNIIKELQKLNDENSSRIRNHIINM